MGSNNIRAKVQKGLARAINKTGSSSSESIYLIDKANSGGSTPLDPPVITESKVLLVDAIFKSYDASLFDGDIQSGDRQLVSNSDVAIEQGSIIEQGSLRYIVIDIDIKAPTSDVLVYISQVRAQ